MIEKEIDQKGRHTDKGQEHNVTDLFSKGAGVSEEARQHDVDEKYPKDDGVNSCPVCVAHKNEDYDGNRNVRAHEDKDAAAISKEEFEHQVL